MAFPRWAAGADLMFAEAAAWVRPISFARGAGGNAPVLEVSRLARDAGVRRLVFAHIGRPTIRAVDLPCDSDEESNRSRFHETGPP